MLINLLVFFFWQFLQTGLYFHRTFTLVLNNIFDKDNKDIQCIGRLVSLKLVLTRCPTILRADR